MPLAQTRLSKISPRADLAAAIDAFVLKNRRDDESYGISEDEKSRITITLAVLQAHADKCLPMDSPRLAGAASWLQSRKLDNPDILVAPLRLMAAHAIRANQDIVREELDETRAYIKNVVKTKQVPEAVLFMVALEALGAYDKRDPGFEQGMVLLDQIAEANTHSAAVKSYAAALMLTHGSNNQRACALRSIQRILDQQQEEGDWGGCVVNTAYVILDLFSVEPLPANVDQAANRAIHYIEMHCPGGVPQKHAIRNVPNEVGGNTLDRQTYAGAVITRAILKSIRVSADAPLHFAHASWKRQIEQEEAALNTCRRSSWRRAAAAFVSGAIAGNLLWHPEIMGKAVQFLSYVLSIAASLLKIIK